MFEPSTAINSGILATGVAPWLDPELSYTFLRQRQQYKMSVLSLYAQDSTQTAIFVGNTLIFLLKVLAFRDSQCSRFPR
ncbi:hypothetical protein [Allocoleopsis franciscana]|uniref:Uncharacterized protein n=1 Tax=Allocoleopsis franciscana PCC 7113 TaxID=1173027 RepID=K9WMF1_9CYAN|nr:hypothetical protein [Allocoleopsis franciscana]AFZ20981.1 hypothetical protein Mic7113_5334 [Allocoleopsis franciscana PCC 7113]